MSERDQKIAEQIREAREFLGNIEYLMSVRDPWNAAKMASRLIDRAEELSRLLVEDGDTTMAELQRKNR